METTLCLSWSVYIYLKIKTGLFFSLLHYISVYKAVNKEYFAGIDTSV